MSRGIFDNLDWPDRPLEQARLYNPAFISAILFQLALGAKQENNLGLDFVFSFIAVPILLHPEMRSSLPGKATVSIINWAAENSALLAHLPNKVTRIQGVVKEGTWFGLSQEVLSIEGRYLLPCSDAMKRTSPNSTSETREIQKLAMRLGRMLGNVENPETLYTILGIRP